MGDNLEISVKTREKGLTAFLRLSPKVLWPLVAVVALVVLTGAALAVFFLREAKYFCAPSPLSEAHAGPAPHAHTEATSFTGPRSHAITHSFADAATTILRPAWSSFRAANYATKARQRSPSTTSISTRQKLPWRHIALASIPSSAPRHFMSSFRRHTNGLRVPENGVQRQLRRLHEPSSQLRQLGNGRRILQMGQEAPSVRS